MFWCVACLMRRFADAWGQPCTLASSPRHCVSQQNITQQRSSPASRSCCRNCSTSITGGPLNRKHNSPLRRLLVVVFAEPIKAVLRSATTALAWNAPVEGVPLQSTIVAPARRNRSSHAPIFAGFLPQLAKLVLLVIESARHAESRRRDE